MIPNTRPAVPLLISLLCCFGITAEQQTNPAPQAPGVIILDVVVTPKSGPPVANLQQQDFTVLDDKIPQAIDSFHAVRGRDAQVKVIVVVDDVNTGFDRVAFERSEIDKFLRSDNGSLSYPTALAVLTDAGLQMQNTFSTDGDAIGASLDKYKVPLHTVQRSAGFYGAVERFELSIQALLQLANQEASTPGRKLVLWVSPGWPLLSGPGLESQLDDRQRKQIFENVVSISTLLRRGRITLYAVDPLGTSDSLSRDFYWQSFSKGINSPRQADWGDIALQVLAFQSGGQVLNRSNDIAGELQQCVADAQAYYEISFALSSDQPPEPYHRIEVRIDKPGLTARTLQGYYAVQTAR